jgi:hypothetical protein
MNSSTPLNLVASFLVILIFFISVITQLISTNHSSEQKKFKKYFLNCVISTQPKDPELFYLLAVTDSSGRTSIPEVIIQNAGILALHFSELKRKFPDNQIESINSILSTCLTDIDSLSEKEFKNEYGVSIPEGFRNYLIQILFYFKSIHPFSDLSEKYSIQMSILLKAVEDDNHDLAKNTLITMKGYFKDVDNEVMKTKKLSRLSFTWTIIGVITSIYFGLPSFIQLFH